MTVNDLLIAILGLAFTVLGYIGGKLKNARDEGKKEGVIQAKLDNISSDLTSVKEQVLEVRKELTENNKEIKIELSKRIDNIDYKVGEHDKDISVMKERLDRIEKK